MSKNLNLRSSSESEENAHAQTELKASELIKAASLLIQNEGEQNIPCLSQSLTHQAIIQLLDRLECCDDIEKRKTIISDIRYLLSKHSTILSFDSLCLKLSPTELKIATWIRQGKTTKDIVRLGKFSEKTVYWHRSNIREKLLLSDPKISIQSYLRSLK